MLENIFLSSYGDLFGQGRFLNHGMTTGPGEGKLWIKSCLKIDLASHPACAEELVSRYMHSPFSPLFSSLFLSLSHTHTHTYTHIYMHVCIDLGLNSVDTKATVTVIRRLFALRLMIAWTWNWQSLNTVVSMLFKPRSTIFTDPSAWAGYDTRSIFKRSLTGLNSEFSFS